MGLVPFDAHSDSQENSLSCDPFTLSNDRHGADDILIIGSLSEIGTHDNSKWDDPLPNTSSLNQLEASAETGKEWYQDEEGEGVSLPPHNQDSLSGSTQEKAPQTDTTHSKQLSQKSLEALTRIVGSFEV
jgi:hypothetical protein